MSRNGSLGRPRFFLRVAACQSAQRLSTARQPGTDRPHGNTEDRRDLIVAHALKRHEQNCGSLRAGQLGEGAFEIAQFEPFSLLGCASEHRLTLGQSDRRSLAGGSSNIIHVLMMQNRKQPRSQICSLLPKMQFTEGARETILDEIVSRDGVMRQGASIAAKAGNFGFDLPMLATHQRHSAR
jgi:hypothetical protein